MTGARTGRQRAATAPGPGTAATGAEGRTAAAAAVRGLGLSRQGGY